MARLLHGPRRRGRGHRHARRCACGARGHQGRAGRRRWSAGCAARCCCSDRCWRGAAARGSRRPAATFRRGAPSRRISRRSSRWARASLDGPGHALEAPDGLKPASIYLYEASVTGTETALLAAAARAGRHRDPPRRVRAARRRAVRVPRKAGRRHHRRGHVDDPRRRRRAGCTAPSIGSGATTSRPAAGRSSPRSPAARSRSAARGPRTWKSSPPS